MKKIIVSLIIVVTIAGIFPLGYFYYYTNIKKYSYFDTEIELIQGKNLNNLLKDLKISNTKLAKLYLKISKQDSKIKAGYYELHGEYSFKELVGIFVKGKYKKIKITIPEGYTLEQIINTLKEKELIDEEKFLKILSKKEDFYFIRVNNSYEGYFYPDTYYFYKNEGEEKIINTILGRFLKEFPPEKYTNKDEFYKKLIMASIIEKEAYHTDEKGKIASVFYNRLRKNIKLESCATVEYIYHYSKAKLSYDDLKVESDYNTYKIYGLPPTPISNPGLESIKAAIYPDNTDYLYFVADEDRRHIFSKTYKEHLKNKAKIRK